MAFAAGGYHVDMPCEMGALKAEDKMQGQEKLSAMDVEQQQALLGSGGKKASVKVRKPPTKKKAKAKKKKKPPAKKRVVIEVIDDEYGCEYREAQRRWINKIKSGPIPTISDEKRFGQRPGGTMNPFFDIDDVPIRQLTWDELVGYQSNDNEVQVAEASIEAESVAAETASPSEPSSNEDSTTLNLLLLYFLLTAYDKEEIPKVWEEFFGPEASVAANIISQSTDQALTTQLPQTEL